jgi:hypothetical protein
VKIAYGITTTVQRIDNLLPQTILSLERAGFDCPHLFVDGCTDAALYHQFNLPMTMRCRQAGNFGNWYAGMVELFALNPDADRFLMFEDDIAAVAGLREYLEAVPIPRHGYCNLYNGGSRNLVLSEKEPDGWFQSDQRASGALGLMFERETVIQCLGSEVFVRERLNKNSGDMKIDGAICLALRRDPARTVLEYVHKPSLLQHTGRDCSLLDPIRKERGLRVSQPEESVSRLFPGEEFDARSLL